MEPNESRIRIDRGQDPDDYRYPHLVYVDGEPREWIGDKFADALEPLIALAGAAAVPPGGRRPMLVRDCHEIVGYPDALQLQTAPGEVKALGLCRWQTEWLERHPEVLAAPAADPLPEGVHRAPDGTLLAKGCDRPEGWERLFNADRDGWSDEPVPSHCLGMWYEVRPVPPQPETVQVPWQEAPGRRLPDGRVIDVAVPLTADHARTGPCVVAIAGASGTVSVLVDGDPK